VWVRAQKSFWLVRTGMIGTFQDVSFGSRNDQFSSIGADVTLDTRADPVLPRNAVLVMASAERIFMVGGPPITRMRVEGNGYIGLFGQHVLIVRGLMEDANRSQPPYMRSIMGGWSTVRGYETGFLTGDTMTAASLEWRMPIPTPLRFGKVGVSAFADWGTAYDDGQAFKDQTIYRGWAAPSGSRSRPSGSAWRSATGAAPAPTCTSAAASDSDPRAFPLLLCGSQCLRGGCHVAADRRVRACRRVPRWNRAIRFAAAGHRRSGPQES
jgi:hypothetical protein